jgi:hypothetical protein
MTERHVVANGDLPPDRVVVWAYWDESKWPEAERWGIAMRPSGDGNDDYWEVWANGRWDIAWTPTYWWTLPEVAP